jgi:hypothetical protein
MGPGLTRHHVTDDELVASLRGRNLLFVFLNGGGTMALCRRVQLECGIPVVMGWDAMSTSSQRLVMVRTFLFVSYLLIQQAHKTFTLWHVVCVARGLWRGGTRTRRGPGGRGGGAFRRSLSVVEPYQRPWLTTPRSSSLLASVRCAPVNARM